MLPEHKHTLESILSDAVTRLVHAAIETANVATNTAAGTAPPAAGDEPGHAARAGNAGALAVPAAPTAAHVAILLERPKSAAHGDVACNVAMQIAKPLRSNPRQLAEQIVAAVLADPRAAGLLAGAEVAGPGFINFRLADAARQAVVAEVLTKTRAYGRSNAHAGERVLVEFVSANPTGPLHVGHGRQAALGDALAHVLETQGWDVWREFYYNDAGVQIQTLAHSVQARARGFTPGDDGWPESAYNGNYIGDIARDYLAKKTVAANDGAPVQGAGDIDDFEAIRRFAVAYLRHEQDIDLQAFGVRFDHYYLESSLYADGRVDGTVAGLIGSGKTYEQDSALWLRTTDYGDDKDRVMRKSDGTFTYFLPDVAYHVAKWQRGFTKVINVQGSDHHGTIARVRAGLQALSIGIPAGYPDYILHKMVTVLRNGQEVKISKRAGSYVTVRDLIEWSGGAPVDGEAPAAGASESGIESGDTPAATLTPTDPSSASDTPTTGKADTDGTSDTSAIIQRGRDAVRFFLISRKADTEFVFDVDLALKQNDENPVYYVQYAHARICSILATWGGEPASLRGADLTPLTSERAIALLARLAEYPDMLARAADELAPHALAFYLRDLAGDFHSFYNADRVLVDDEQVKRARLALLAATRQVLENGLATIGVSAPAKM